MPGLGNKIERQLAYKMVMWSERLGWADPYSLLKLEERFRRVAVLKPSKLSMDSKCSDALGQSVSILVVPCRDASNGGDLNCRTTILRALCWASPQLFNVGQLNPVLPGHMAEVWGFVG